MSNPPIAVHEVAFVEDQESVEELPLSMISGFAESVAVGGGEGGFTVTEVVQGCVTDGPPKPEVTLTLPVFVPVVEYPLANVTGLPVLPPRGLLPDQE